MGGPGGPQKFKMGGGQGGPQNLDDRPLALKDVDISLNINRQKIGIRYYTYSRHRTDVARDFINLI